MRLALFKSSGGHHLLTTSFQLVRSSYKWPALIDMKCKTAVNNLIVAYLMSMNAHVHYTEPSNYAATLHFSSSYIFCMYLHVHEDTYKFRRWVFTAVCMQSQGSLYLIKNPVLKSYGNIIASWNMKTANIWPLACNHGTWKYRCQFNYVFHCSLKNSLDWFDRSTCLKWVKHLKILPLINVSV